MSDCCLPNLGCLSIPVISTNVAGNPGATGAAGNGIASESYDPLTGELELTFTDSTTFTTGDLRGAAGAPGAAGVNGVARLYSNQTPNSVAAPIGSYVTMDSYTLPANTLATDGDAVVVTIYAKNVTKGYDSFRIVEFGGYNMCQISFLAGDPYMLIPSLYNASFYLYKLNVEIIRTSSTTVKSRVYADLDCLGSNLPAQIEYEGYFFASPAFDFTQPIPILTRLKQSAANEVIFTSVTIDKIKKL